MVQPAGEGMKGNPRMNKEISAIDKNPKLLLEQVNELKAQLEEAEQTIKAIRNGQVDALVVEGEDKPRVYTLEDADLPYRSIVETMAAVPLH
jgi:hypothetical protein